MIDADDLRYLLRQPIAFHRALADVAGGATGGLFLSQLLYWSDKGRDPDGWIYKTQEEWHAETALTRSEQERARRVLRDLGVLHEQRRGVPARLYYRLDFGCLASLLDPAIKDARNARASLHDPALKDAASREHLHTETTTDNTREDDRAVARKHATGRGLPPAEVEARIAAHTAGDGFNLAAFMAALPRRR